MRSKVLYSILFLASQTGCGGHVSNPAPVEEPAQARTQVPTATPRALSRPAASGAPAQAEVLFQVLASIGVDYKSGGGSHMTGFDCSGLVAHVFREGYGISLPRNTQGQSQVGRPVSAADLQPGDLVFYNTLNRPFSHVGIYLGDGRFVHAPKTGSTVRIESLTSTYWAKRWNGARRIAVQI
ncbi:MAG: peptidoglycan endopeptidase [Betaproteobacteria bacterium]|nr:peptidoglycan endopeptidase [Betaproteobacteria bacterium]